MARLVGQKRAREMWFLSKFYDAGEALTMGLVNAVVSAIALRGSQGRPCIHAAKTSFQPHLT
jgi:naphthoate synthase